MRMETARSWMLTCELICSVICYCLNPSISSLKFISNICFCNSLVDQLRWSVVSLRQALLNWGTLCICFVWAMIGYDFRCLHFFTVSKNKQEQQRQIFYYSGISCFSSHLKSKRVANADKKISQTSNSKQIRLQKLPYNQ